MAETIKYTNPGAGDVLNNTMLNQIQRNEAKEEPVVKGQLLFVQGNGEGLDDAFKKVSRAIYFANMPFPPYVTCPSHPLLPFLFR